MLGSDAEAEDAVQAAWLRLSRTDLAAVNNLAGWLTTTVSRVCLNVLQARRNRPEVPLDDDVLDGRAAQSDLPGPEEEAELADSVALALLVVLERLSPAERVAFVLHDLFAVPFEEVGAILDRSAAAARQLASRGRRRVRESEGHTPAEEVRDARVVEAFLAAARHGEFELLLGLLDPDVVLTADPAAVAIGTTPEIHGAEAVARFSRRARGAAPAVVEGDAGLAWVVDGAVRVLYRFAVSGGRITRIELTADPAALRELRLALVSHSG